jgi:hypothetical protein
MVKTRSSRVVPMKELARIYLVMVKVKAYPHLARLAEKTYLLIKGVKINFDCQIEPLSPK